MAGDDGGGASWTTWIKILVTFAAAVAALWFLPRFLEEAASDPDALWMHGFALGIGGVAFYLGWRELRERQLIRNIPTSKVRSLAVGAVEVKGEARPADEALTSPLTGQEASIYQLEILRYNPGGEESNWNSVLEVGRRVPFEVDDGTGAVRVEPDGATLDLQLETTVEVDGGDPPPEGLPEWAEEEGLLDDMALQEEAEGRVSGAVAGAAESAFEGRARKHLADTSPRKRRYKETVLASGDSAYVFGGARTREGAGSTENPENLVVREHEGTGTFLVSDRSEPELVEEKLFNTALLLAIGTVLLAYGGLGLLRWLGAL